MMPKIAGQASLVLQVTLVAGAIAVTACSGKPTVGDQILAQGKSTAAIGSKWNQANEMITKGQNLGTKGRQQIKDGQKLISDGQDNIKKGDSMISQGRALMAEAEAEYKAAQAHPQTVVIPPRPH